MEPAGTILSVYEGMIVLQGPPNSRALCEGWVAWGRGEQRKGSDEAGISTLSPCSL